MPARIKRALTSLALLILLAPASALCAPKAAYTWTKLADGIEYAAWSFALDSEEDRSSIHAFQVDPKKLRIDVVTSPREENGSTAGELVRNNKALLAINGGFFTPAHRSIGLIIKDGKEVSPIHGTSWWSIFTISAEGPKIYTPREFKAIRGVRMALQVGPRLAVDGQIPKLKESEAARSAVGITKDGKVVIAITQGPGISMTELAGRMSASRSAGGLECPNAMALDGGGSSQLYARIKDFELSLPGLARVTNGLAVFSK
ncbi:MAG: phosphodiester glycosidase family protein [Pseudomonadota bacterium]